MAVLVYSVVNRHMKRTSPGAFTRFAGAARVPADVKLVPGETIVGWYRNPSPWEQCLIVFTSHAFYYLEQLAGPIAAVSGHLLKGPGDPRGGDTRNLLALRMASGATAAVCVNNQAPLGSGTDQVSSAGTP